MDELLERLMLLILWKGVAVEGVVAVVAELVIVVAAVAAYAIAFGVAAYSCSEVAFAVVTAVAVED